MGGSSSKPNMTLDEELRECMKKCRDINLNKAEARQKQINKKIIQRDAEALVRKESAQYQQKRNREKAELGQGINMGIETSVAAMKRGGASKKKSRRYTKRKSVKRKNSLKKSQKKRRNRKIRRNKKK